MSYTEWSAKFFREIEHLGCPSEVVIGADKLQKYWEQGTDPIIAAQEVFDIIKELLT